MLEVLNIYYKRKFNIKNLVFYKHLYYLCIMFETWHNSDFDGYTPLGLTLMALVMALAAAAFCFILGKTILRNHRHVCRAKQYYLMFFFTTFAAFFLFVFWVDSELKFIAVIAAWAVVVSYVGAAFWRAGLSREQVAAIDREQNRRDRERYKRWERKRRIQEEEQWRINQRRWNRMVRGWFK